MKESVGVGSAVKAYFKGKAFVFTRREKLYAIVAIGTFVFLFLLFFQPFGVNNYDPREKITPLFFGVMVLMGLLVSALLAANEFLLYPLVVRQPSRWQMGLWLAWSVVWLGSGVFLFYNFLGGWHDLYWSSYLNFLGNIAAMSSIPLAAALWYSKMRAIQSAPGTHARYIHSSGGNEGEELIVIREDNQKNQLTIPVKYLVYMASDDNYVSVYHLKNDALSKTLLRKSLKSVEEENLHPALKRCHRSYLVNMLHLEGLQGNRNNLKIQIKHLPHPLPVSRQYADSILALTS